MECSKYTIHVRIISFQDQKHLTVNGCILKRLDMRIVNALMSGIEDQVLACDSPLIDVACSMR